MTTDAFVLVTQLTMGFSLAAATGFRAFLPLLVAGLVARFGGGWVELGDSFAWLSSTPALVVFGSAVLFETVGDKVPAIDHALDTGGIVVKPLAATLLSASMFTEMDPLFAAALGLATGGAVAGTVHVVKAKTRLVSSVFTAGFGNPILSVIEDLIAILGIVLAILIPLLAAMIVVALLLVSAIVLRRMFGRLTPSKRGSTSAPASVA